MAGYNHPNTLVGQPVGTSGNTAVSNPYAAPGAMDRYYADRAAQQNAAAWGTAGAPTGAFNAQPQQNNPYALAPPSIDWSMLGAIFGGGGQQGMPSYSSGIDAGPVYSPQQTQAAQQAIAGAPAPGMPNMPGMTGAQSSGLADALAAGVRGQAGVAANNFGRDAAGANAQRQLATETARASDGMRSAALAQQMVAQRNQMQLQAQNRILDLLGGVA